MTRLPMAALLVVAACQRSPARIYTDAEIAKLEAQVMAKVAETDVSCVHQELVDFVARQGDECSRACWKLEKDRRHGDPEINVDSNEVAAIDEQCGEKILTAFGRAAAVSPECSPFQVGVRADPLDGSEPGVSGFMGNLHTMHILTRHALREVDPYVGITELLMGMRVYQDLARGRIDLIQASMAHAAEGDLLPAAEKILQRSSFTNEQLDDIAATLDTIIASEPTPGEMLQGEALTVALHFGLAGLKPKDWEPPGGRGELTVSNEHLAASQHDRRDDAAELMARGLRETETYALACPSQATLATCYANLSKDPPGEIDLHAMDKQSARVRAFPDDETRHDSQKQLLDAQSTDWALANDMQRRAVAVTRLIALRLRVQVLRDGRCPSDAQLAESTYATLRTPAVLGDTVRVVLTDGQLVVDAPAWATKPPIMPAYATKSPFPPPIKRPVSTVTIACPE